MGGVTDAIRPMLAVTAPAALSMLSLPMMASPKLDGIRAIKTDAGLMSRSGKLIPNKAVQARFAAVPVGLDGELIVGATTAPDVFNRTQSQLIRRHGPATDVTFNVFDMVGYGGLNATQRQDLLHACALEQYPFVDLVHQTWVHSIEEVMAYETEALTKGYEGVMLRNPHCLYKHGRATLRAQELVKLKRFRDAEAVIVGTVEMQHNMNDLETSALGFAKRSKSAEGMVPAGVLGALVVRDCATGVMFEIGTGFTAAERRKLWEVRRDLVINGCLVTYKYQPHGVKDKPRAPVFLRLRTGGF